MNLNYQEILNLKGRELLNVNTNSAECGKIFKVTSSTRKNVVLNNGITIKTDIFFQTKQYEYILLSNRLIP